MAENSKIEWCRHTFNCWVGCTKLKGHGPNGSACDFCYAETWARRSGHPELWQGERRRTTEQNWRQPIKWDRAAAAAGERHRVFCASLADVFDNQVPVAWRLDLFALIRDTPNLDWLLLTKRPENIHKMLPVDWSSGYRNVWLGTTCEDQLNFDRRYAKLAAIPAAVHFVSYEPALGPLTLPGVGQERPDWIICGGESGSKPRMMDLQWARDLRDQCASAGVAYFFKQTTGKKPIPDDLMVRQFPR